jgi:hypothetical protein
MLAGPLHSSAYSYLTMSSILICMPCSAVAAACDPPVRKKSLALERKDPSIARLAYVPIIKSLLFSLYVLVFSGLFFFFFCI